MHRALTLYHLRISRLIKLIFAVFLVIPGTTEADEDCQRIMENQILPVDAALFLAPTRMQMNGPVFCLAGFRTGMQSARLIQLYENHWGDQQALINIDQNQLLLKSPTRSTHLRVVEQSHRGSTATLSVMTTEAASMALKNVLPEVLPGLEIIHAQQSGNGQTLMVKTRWQDEQLVQRLMNAFTAAGWQSTLNDDDLLNEDSQTLRRGADLLHITSGIRGQPDLALIQLITPMGAP